MYTNGKESARYRYKKYFLPKGKITTSAFNTHGYTIDMLKEKGAKMFTNGDSQKLVNFLNIEKDYPIVAHFAKYDKEDVLKPAFKRVGNI